MMDLTIDGFDWDAGNTSKIKSHDVLPEEVEEFFRQVGIYVSPDIKHSQKEKRYLAVGSLPNGRPMIVIFTFRERGDKRLIRPISARFMHEKEARKYEEENSKIKKR